MRLLPQEESTAVGMHDFGTRQEESAQRSYLAGFGLHVSMLISMFFFTLLSIIITIII